MHRLKILRREKRKRGRGKELSQVGKGGFGDHAGGRTRQSWVGMIGLTVIQVAEGEIGRKEKRNEESVEQGEGGHRVQREAYYWAE